MSIGYDILPGGSELASSGVRRLKALKLWEISTVTFGMNGLARVEDVKAANNIDTIREFEEFLRDVGGFSHKQAKRIASAGWTASEPRDEVDETQAQLLGALASFNLP